MTALKDATLSPEKDRSSNTTGHLALMASTRSAFSATTAEETWVAPTETSINAWKATSGYSSNKVKAWWDLAAEVMTAVDAWQTQYTSKYATEVNAITATE